MTVNRCMFRDGKYLLSVPYRQGKENATITDPSGNRDRLGARRYYRHFNLIRLYRSRGVRFGASPRDHHTIDFRCNHPILGRCMVQIERQAYIDRFVPQSSNDSFSDCLRTTGSTLPIRTTGQCKVDRARQ